MLVWAEIIIHPYIILHKIYVCIARNEMIFKKICVN